MQTPQQILETHWGFNTFKPLQKEIIDAVCAGQDTLALLPTGGGKSLCYQIPALLTEGICLVVSPLIALMNDQINALKNKQIGTLSLQGALSVNRQIEIIENAIHGPYKFLFLSPERIQNKQITTALARIPVSIITVDEAHCISEWGHDFRPAYSQLQILKTLFPKATTLALTATATPRVIKDIQHTLMLKNMAFFKASFARPAITIKVEKNTQPLERTFQILSTLSKKHTEPFATITYVRSRKAARDVADFLNSKGLASSFFHGKLSVEAKTQALAHWKSCKTPHMIATTAFGMGIDHAHVRCVMHLDIPESIESYYQEIGRAARDGASATVYLLYHEGSLARFEAQFENQIPDYKKCVAVLKALYQYFQLPYGEGTLSEFPINLTDFCQKFKQKLMPTYAALQMLERLNIIKLLALHATNTSIRFLYPHKALMHFFDHNKKAAEVGKTLLRIYGNLYHTESQIDLEILARKAGFSIPEVRTELHKMHRLGVVAFQEASEARRIQFLTPREDAKTLAPYKTKIKQYTHTKQTQLQAVKTYIFNTNICRQAQLLNYFNESFTSCGLCDVCSSNRKGIDSRKAQVLLESQILETLKSGEKDSHQIMQNCTFESAEVIEMLRYLVQRKKITMSAFNTYQLIQ